MSNTVADTRRPGRRLLVGVVGVIILLAFETWGIARNANRVRAVVYNDGPGALAEVTVACGDDSRLIGDFPEESSHYLWFQPEDRSAMIAVAWFGAQEAHRDFWRVEKGERLTVRIGAGGETTVTRERSIGRRLVDALN